jgi:plasmid stability protein
LTMLKYRIRWIRHTEATEREAKAIERNRIHEYKKQQAIDNAARELQKKRELLLK